MFCWGIAWVLVDQMVHHLQIKECFASSASLVCHLPPSFLTPALLTVAFELLSAFWFKKNHLVISFLWFDFFLLEHYDSLWIHIYWLPAILWVWLSFHLQVLLQEAALQVISSFYKPLVWVCARTLTCCYSVAWSWCCQSFLAMGLWDRELQLQKIPLKKAFVESW